MKIKIVLLVCFIALSLNTSSGYFCTWTFNYEDLHIADITTSNNTDVLLVTINDATQSPRTVGFNLTDSTFLSNKSFSPVYYDLIDGYTNLDNKYSNELYTNNDNVTIWKLYTNNGYQIFSKPLNISFENKIMFMTSEEYNKAYLVVKEVNYSERYTLIMSGLDNQSVISYSDFWLFGYYFNRGFSSLMVNEGEKLAYLAPGCCYCGVGDFFTFDEYGIYQFISADSIAKFNRFDPRSNRFIVATFSGNLTVYNYVINESTYYNIDLLSMNNFLSQKGMIGFEIPIFLGTFTIGSIIGILVKRKRG